MPPTEDRAEKLAASLPALGSVLEFMRVIWALENALQKTSSHMARRLGVTAPQRLVIRILGRFPGMQAGQLAAILHLHPSTLTGILKRLQRRGFITRRADPRDHRRASFGLTPKGRALDVQTEGTVEAAAGETFSKLAPRKVENAAEVLGMLTEALDARVRS